MNMDVDKTTDYDYVTATRNEALAGIRAAVHIEHAKAREEAIMHFVTVIQVLERLRGTQDGRST